VRSIGLDVHRDFCEVAIEEGGRVRAVGRIDTGLEQIELFARSLRAEDRPAARSSRQADRAARCAGGGRQHAQAAAISQASAKTDRLTPARSRGCWRRVISKRCGCPPSGRGRCAA
jgi:hypothetical protein